MCIRDRVILAQAGIQDGSIDESIYADDFRFCAPFVGGPTNANPDDPLPGLPKAPNPNPNPIPNPNPSPSPDPNLGQAGQRVVRARVGGAADKRGAEAEVVGVDGLVDRAVLDARLREDHLLASVDQVVWLYREGRRGLAVMTVRVCA